MNKKSKHWKPSFVGIGKDGDIILPCAFFVTLDDGSILLSLDPGLELISDLTPLEAFYGVNDHSLFRYLYSTIIDPMESGCTRGHSPVSCHSCLSSKDRTNNERSLQACTMITTITDTLS